VFPKKFNDDAEEIFWPLEIGKVACTFQDSEARVWECKQPFLIGFDGIDILLSGDDEDRETDLAEALPPVVVTEHE
jgi:hypothetical protein